MTKDISERVISERFEVKTAVTGDLSLTTYYELISLVFYSTAYSYYYFRLKTGFKTFNNFSVHQIRLKKTKILSLIGNHSHKNYSIVI